MKKLLSYNNFNYSTFKLYIMGIHYTTVYQWEKLIKSGKTIQNDVPYIESFYMLCVPYILNNIAFILVSFYAMNFMPGFVNGSTYSYSSIYSILVHYIKNKYFSSGVRYTYIKSGIDG